MKTPHLDQLTAEGAVFDACITRSVICQPARASILTGQHYERFYHMDGKGDERTNYVG